MRKPENYPVEIWNIAQEMTVENAENFFKEYDERSAEIENIFCCENRYKKVDVK
jgi:hypothetical protein